MNSNFTLPGFAGDDYEDDEPMTPLTAAQIAARDAEWPEFAGAHVNDIEFELMEQAQPAVSGWWAETAYDNLPAMAA